MFLCAISSSLGFPGGLPGTALGFLIFLLVSYSFVASSSIILLFFPIPIGVSGRVRDGLCEGPLSLFFGVD